LGRLNAEPITGLEKGDRLFAALELSKEIQARLSNLQALIPGLKWTPAANLHLTLRFLGLVPPDKTERVREALRRVKGDSFPLAVAGLGLFQKRTGAVLWAGASREPALEKLKKEVDEALRASAGLSLAEERFFPHITLSRLKTPAPGSLKKTVREKAAERFGETAVAGFTLFRSILAPSGAVHEPVERYLC